MYYIGTFNFMSLIFVALRLKMLLQSGVHALLLPSIAISTIIVAKTLLLYIVLRTAC